MSSTTRRSARSTDAEGSSRARSRRRPQLVRAAERGVRGGARGGVLEGARAAIIDDGDEALDRRLRRPRRRRSSPGSQRVQQALVEDWDDLVEMDDEQTRRSSDRRETRDDPEHATRLNRFRVNLLVSHDAGLAAARPLRHEPDVPEPLRLPRAARALRRALDRLHPHPRGLAPQGERGRARRPGGRPADRPDHLGADEARAARAADRRRRSARPARPLRHVASPGAGPASRARRARRPAGALRDAAPGRSATSPRSFASRSRSSRSSRARRRASSRSTRT